MQIKQYLNSILSFIVDKNTKHFSNPHSFISPIYRWREDKCFKRTSRSPKGEGAGNFKDGRVWPKRPPLKWAAFFYSSSKEIEKKSLTFTL